MSLNWETLEVTITKTEGVIDSAIAAFRAIAEELRVINADANPKITAYAARIDAKADALAEAIAANPGEPPPA